MGKRLKKQSNKLSRAMLTQMSTMLSACMSIPNRPRPMMIIASRRFIHGPASVLPETLTPFLDARAITSLRDEVRAARVGDAVRRYVVELVRATRRVDGVELGGSPRAALALYRAAQAHAAIRGRAYVLPDDVKAQATAVLRHRLFLSADAQMRGRTTPTVIAEVLARTPVPAEDVAASAS